MTYAFMVFGLILLIAPILIYKFKYEKEFIKTSGVYDAWETHDKYQKILSKFGIVGLIGLVIFMTSTIVALLTGLLK